MTGSDLVARIDAAFADLQIGLERFAEITGDNRVRHAAHILRGRKGGRPPIDDHQALAEITRLVATGKPMRTALAIAARKFGSENADAESLKRRWRRKLKNSDEIDFVRPEICFDATEGQEANDVDTRKN